MRYKKLLTQQKLRSHAAYQDAVSMEVHMNAACMQSEEIIDTSGLNTGENSLIRNIMQTYQPYVYGAAKPSPLTKS